MQSYTKITMQQYASTHHYNYARVYNYNYARYYNYIVYYNYARVKQEYNETNYNSVTGTTKQITTLVQLPVNTG